MIALHIFSTRYDFGEQRERWINPEEYLALDRASLEAKEDQRL